MCERTFEIAYRKIGLAGESRQAKPTYISIGKL